MDADSSQGTDTRSEIQLASIGTEESNDNDRQAEVSVNIDDAVNHIMSRINAYSEVCEGYRVICRVPDKFHRANGDAYAPFIFSFGPYHYGNERLSNMEKHKAIILKTLLNKGCSPGIEGYVKEIKSMEARKYYSEEIKLEDTSFIEMLLIDGCCLLALMAENFLETHQDICSDENGKSPAAEPNLTLEQIKPGQRLTFFLEMVHDLVLLENQIPFFVLQNIYNVAKGGSTPTGQLESELIKWLKHLMYPELPGTLHGEKPIYHILHLLHSLVRPTLTVEKPDNHSWIRNLFKLIRHNEGPKCNNLDCKNPKCENSNRPRRWRRAIEYHEAGVSFKRKEKPEEYSLLDLEFRDGTLLIPLLEINNLTEPLFRNLVALEIETNQHGCDVSSYMLFMSDLLSMPEDVTLLSRKDIILHNLGSDNEVSQLFKGIRMHPPSDMKLGKHMRKLYCQLEKHHGSRWNRWKAWLKHRHLSNPWLVMALLAAVVILVFTVLQGVYAAVSYKPSHKPSHKPI